MEIKRYEDLSSQELIDAICSDLTIEEDKIIKRNIVFRSKDEAKIYFSDMLKIYDNVLVKCVEILEKYEDSSEYAQVEDKLNNALKEYVNFPNLMLEKLKSQKSNQKGCSVCKSSINRDFFVKSIEDELERISSIELNKDNYQDVLKEKIETLQCPVCNDEKFVITETDEGKYKSLKNKVSDAFAKVEEDKVAYELKHGQKVVDLIGYRFDIKE